MFSVLSCSFSCFFVDCFFDELEKSGAPMGVLSKIENAGDERQRFQKVFSS
jgi:hypothetical protein